jgi:TPR repeat protein
MNAIPAFLYFCGIYYLQKRNFEQAMYAFFVASKYQHAVATRELGVMLIRGQGCDVQLHEGARLLYEAERLGDKDASLILDSYMEF